MGLPDNDRGRPLAEAPSNVVTTDIHSVEPRTDDVEPPRCVICGHMVFSRESIAAGIGRDCRRRLKAGLTTADDAVRIAYAAALLRATGGVA